MAIIGGNSQPLQRELLAVQKMARQTGASLQRDLSGGHLGSSGIIRETLVLMRELSRGNWTRVPGSFSILLQRMGVLKLLAGDTAASSRILADAWAAQAEKAGLAAVAATRKAQASKLAGTFEKDGVTWTLKSALADEQAAKQAILYAKELRGKAEAAREAAAAQSAMGAAGGVGAFGVIGGVIVGLAAGIWAGVKQIQIATKSLGGMDVKDFNPEYIAKHLQAINRIADEQKEVNKEVQRTVDLYNSAAKSAERMAETTKDHFDHLRKMNSFEKDPAKRAANQLEIDKQERVQDLANKYVEKYNLEREAEARQAQAMAIQVSSKEHDEQLLNQKKQAAEEAQKFLDSSPSARTFGNAVVAANPFSGVSAKDINAALDAKKAEARQRITDYKATVDQVAANEELRKKREDLIKQAGGSAAAAAAIGLQIPDLQKRFNQRNADEAAEMAAELSAKRGSVMRGHVNSLQQVGAYTQSAHIDLARRQLDALHKIEHNTGRGGHGRTGGGDGVNFGDRH